MFYFSRVEKSEVLSGRNQKHKVLFPHSLDSI